MTQIKHAAKADVFLSCIEETYYSKETLIQKNTLIRVVSGEMRIVQLNATQVLRAGDTVLFPRNQLAKVTKFPVDGQPYRAVAIHFTQEWLRTYYTEHPINPVRPDDAEIKVFDSHPLLDSLLGSLLPYFALTSELPAELAAVKVGEAMAILRLIDKQIDRILGHFDDPGKLDLSDFMEKNYMFNMPAEQFGYLTGRSLTSFKRDFKKTYNTTPQKWLTKKRLELAHHLIVGQQRKPSDVYFDAGFENLSHFSFAFKKQFGYTPASLLHGLLNKETLVF